MAMCRGCGRTLSAVDDGCAGIRTMRSLMRRRVMSGVDAMDIVCDADVLARTARSLMK